MRSLLLLAEMLVLLPMAIRAPIVGVLVFDWVSFMNPQQVSWGPASSLPWALAAFLATVLGMALNPSYAKRLTPTPMIVLMVLFVAGIWLNSQFALGSPKAEYEGLIRATKIFVMLIITEMLLINRRRIDAVIWIGTISLGYYIIDQGGITLLRGGIHKSVGPPNSMISDTNEFSAALVVILPLLNYLRLQARYKIIRAGFMLAMGFTVLTIVGSFSRGALLGLLGIGGVLWLKSRYKLVTLVGIGGLVLMVVLLMPQTYWDRMYTIIHYQHDASAQGRLEIWVVAWRLFLAHPFTGVGFHATLSPWVVNSVMPDALRRDIHSIWFQVLGEQGIIVFTVWLMMTVLGFLNTRKIVRLTRGRPELEWARDLARMGEISILGYVITGTFLPISAWDFYFTILVILSATRTVVVHAVRANTWQPLSAIAAGRHQFGRDNAMGAAR
ncbi:MAG: putative O-glycosylation ligase, exosortase A system-associated [Acetobacteraceae bacterium]